METGSRGRLDPAKLPEQARNMIQSLELPVFGTKRLPDVASGSLAASPLVRSWPGSLIYELWPRFEYQVEWGFGGATEASEPTGSDDFAQARLAGLGTQAQSDFLR